MQCLRIVSTNVETGERVRNTRIPIVVVKIAARLIPASVFALLDERITKEIARDILDAVPQMIEEVASQPVDPEVGVSGLIADDEAKRGGKYGHPYGATGEGTAEEWTERTLVYIG
ncbi:MAG: hypothetical protein AAF624_17850 [Bacteroidota bacterium]